MSAAKPRATWRTRAHKADPDDILELHCTLLKEHQNFIHVCHAQVSRLQLVPHAQLTPRDIPALRACADHELAEQVKHLHSDAHTAALCPTTLRRLALVTAIELRTASNTRYC